MLYSIINHYNNFYKDFLGLIKRKPIRNKQLEEKKLHL